MKSSIMKYLGILLLFILFFSCNKQENYTRKNETENTLEQKAQYLTNASGEKISVVYFAKGNEVAVKIKIGDQVQELTAKGTNLKGEAIFSNGKCAWELMEDGQSGKLTYKEKYKLLYK